jgi:hypothetical protein
MLTEPCLGCKRKRCDSRSHRDVDHKSNDSSYSTCRGVAANEGFFEPPGSEHLISENASATEPASLLAVFVADDGAQLTTFGK